MVLACSLTSGCGGLAAQAPQSTPVSATRASPIAQLRGFLAERPLVESIDAPFARQPLTAAEADQAEALLWDARLQRLRDTRRTEWEARRLEADGASLRFFLRDNGEAPAGGRSLWISLHGGGGAPAARNDQQWDNQKDLYWPEEGAYVAPRGPSDDWDLWHKAHVDTLLDRLIEDAVALHGVDPNRVYLLGYSAGGDGVYQLGPRLSDRFAAASMMAGHPNETSPVGLRNLPFSIWVGALDSAYDRADVAAAFGERLDALRAADPEGYDHELHVLAGKGHWMDEEDARALPWMAARTRVRYPRRIVWKQDDVSHGRFYWLEMPDHAGRDRPEVRAEVEGQTVRIQAPAGPLGVLLNDDLIDLDRSVRVVANGRVVFEGTLRRDLENLWRSMSGGGAMGLHYPARAEVVVP